MTYNLVSERNTCSIELNRKYKKCTGLTFKKPLTRLIIKFWLTNFSTMALEEQLIKWFKSYLENRRKFVTINGYNSE